MLHLLASKIGIAFFCYHELSHRLMRLGVCQCGMLVFWLSTVGGVLQSDFGLMRVAGCIITYEVMALMADSDELHVIRS